MHALYVSFNVIKYQREVLGFVGINFRRFCSFKGGRPKNVYSQKLGSHPSQRQISTLQDSAVPFPLCSDVGFHSLFTLQKIEWNLSALEGIIKKRAKPNLHPVDTRSQYLLVWRYCDAFKRWKTNLLGPYQALQADSSLLPIGGVVSPAVTHDTSLQASSQFLRLRTDGFLLFLARKRGEKKCSFSHFLFTYRGGW